MQNKFLLIALVLSLSFLISGCASHVPDVPVCFELSMDRGYCINTVSSTEFEVNDSNKLEGKTWWEARSLMLLLPASSWAEIKTFIITICKKTNQCDKNISSWDRTVQSIDKLLVDPN